MFSNEECSEVFKVANLVIDKTKMCAGDRTGSNQDACQGDSGGPLMLNVGESKKQVEKFGQWCRFRAVCSSSLSMFRVSSWTL